MALMNCPECNRQVSDKATACPHCGCPIEGFAEQKFMDELYDFENGKRLLMIDSYQKVKKCNEQEAREKVNAYWKKRFPYANIQDTPPQDQQAVQQNVPAKQFNGVYRMTLFHGLQEVYCPCCGSENCSHHHEVVPAKVKTTYSANLNPFKPFTFINKKEKVIQNERTVNSFAFICNKCGNIFY